MMPSMAALLRPFTSRDIDIDDAPDPRHQLRSYGQAIFHFSWPLPEPLVFGKGNLVGANFPLSILSSLFTNSSTML